MNMSGVNAAVRGLFSDDRLAWFIKWVMVPVVVLDGFTVTYFVIWAITK